jgi:hypothetical protein
LEQGGHEVQRFVLNPVPAPGASTFAGEQSGADPELLADESQLLPASPHDYDFDALWHHLIDGGAARRMRLI